MIGAGVLGDCGICGVCNAAAGCHTGRVQSSLASVTPLTERPRGSPRRPCCWRNSWATGGFQKRPKIVCYSSLDLTEEEEARCHSTGWTGRESSLPFCPVPKLNMQQPQAGPGLQVHLCQSACALPRAGAPVCVGRWPPSGLYLVRSHDAGGELSGSPQPSTPMTHALVGVVEVGGGVGAENAVFCPWLKSSCLAELQGGGTMMDGDCPCEPWAGWQGQVPGAGGGKRGVRIHAFIHSAVVGGTSFICSTVVRVSRSQATCCWDKFQVSPAWSRCGEELPGEAGELGR